jgi:hypothetical protein
MERKTYEKIGLWFIIGIVIYGTFLSLTNDWLSGITQNMISMGQFVLPLLFYYLSQPLYILTMIMITFIYRHIAVRAFFASIFIIEATDIWSAPHCLPKIFPIDGNIGLTNYLCSDTIFVNLFNHTFHLSYTFAWYLYYLIVPILLILISLLLLGLFKFGKQVADIGKPEN